MPAIIWDFYTTVVRFLGGRRPQSITENDMTDTEAQRECRGASHGSSTPASLTSLSSNTTNAPISQLGADPTSMETANEPTVTLTKDDRNNLVEMLTEIERRKTAMSDLQAQLRESTRHVADTEQQLSWHDHQKSQAADGDGAEGWQIRQGELEVAWSNACEHGEGVTASLETVAFSLDFEYSLLVQKLRTVLSMDKNVGLAAVQPTTPAQPTNCGNGESTGGKTYSSPAEAAQFDAEVEEFDQRAEDFRVACEGLEVAHTELMARQQDVENWEAAYEYYLSSYEAAISAGTTSVPRSRFDEIQEYNSQMRVQAYDWAKQAYADAWQTAKDLDDHVSQRWEGSPIHSSDDEDAPENLARLVDQAHSGRVDGWLSGTGNICKPRSAASLP